MTMGEKIKYHRELLDLSQDELGKKLDPAVNKAAIQKWEKGTVENIKRIHIKQMASLFDITACELLSFDDNQDGSADTKKICDLMYKCYGKEAYTMVQMYFELNQTGKEKALERMRELTKISDYTDKEKRDSQRMA